MYYLVSKIRNIVLYDLASITSPKETMSELQRRLNTCHAFRDDSWTLGAGFDSLWKASMQRDWVADKLLWQSMALEMMGGGRRLSPSESALAEGWQRWQELEERRKQAKATVLQNKEQLRARDSGWEGSVFNAISRDLRRNQLCRKGAE